MNRRGIFTLISAFAVVAIFFSPLKAENRTDSLLFTLDQILEKRDVFMNIKENTIDSIKQLRNQTDDLEIILKLNKSLYEEYKTYQYDSAYHYVISNLELAQKFNLIDIKNQCKLDLSFILTSSGLFNESLKILEEIDRSSLDDAQLRVFYFYHSRVYLDLNRFTGFHLYSDEYWELGNQYLDSLISVFSWDFTLSPFILGQKQTIRGSFPEAQSILQSYMDTIQIYSQQYSMAAATLSFVYSQLNEPELSKKYIIKSAISDINCAITENESLHSLALMMFDEGDIDRAYNYLKISLADANFYNARLRRVEIAKSLPVIESVFLEKLAEERKRLLLSLVFTTLLAIVLIIAVLSISKQIKDLNASKRLIQETNQKLDELNEGLFEANRVKEEYIGHFLNLCSQYIDKIEDFNQLVNRKIKVGQVESLHALVNSGKVIDDELRELLLNFDRIFLKLFPDFINSFNKLFSPKDQFVLKKEELLNTELRIFALIRLGVNDSSKIARFLRYAPNTVYTYRTKIKNKSIVPRDEFEDEIMKIGSFIDN